MRGFCRAAPVVVGFGGVAVASIADADETVHGHHVCGSVTS
jgi:hypothetical protein